MPDGSTEWFVHPMTEEQLKQAQDTPRLADYRGELYDAVKVMFSDFNGKLEKEMEHRGTFDFLSIGEEFNRVVRALKAFDESKYEDTTRGTWTPPDSELPIPPPPQAPTPKRSLRTYGKPPA